MNDDKKKELDIISKYQKSQTINIIITTISILTLPIVIILMLLAENNKWAIEKPLMYVFVGVAVITLMSNVLLRTCPSCGFFMDRYKIFPKHCPNCNVKLRK